MKRSSFADMECPIARALDILGDGWTLLILRDALLGFRCFGEFEERLGIAPTTLTRKLDQLVEDGLLDRVRYTERPPRHEYVLTDKGRELYSVMVAIGAWSNRWLAGRGAEVLVMVDAESGKRVDPILVDASTEKRIAPGSVRLEAGPKASARLKKALVARPVTLGEK
ncbi:MAG: helix-turn-helix transcriptional regulator [Polyangiaceae bacterium]|nr:helix-turn-helix transcriptional regulator [Polyangiaceae bacterium]